MSSQTVLIDLRDKLGVTTYRLGQLLELKSRAHSCMFINGKLTPSVATCKKIIKLGKTVDMVITLDMLLGD